MRRPAQDFMEVPQQESRSEEDRGAKVVTPANSRGGVGGAFKSDDQHQHRSDPRLKEKPAARALEKTYQPHLQDYTERRHAPEAFIPCADSRYVHWKWLMPGLLFFACLFVQNFGLYVGTFYYVMWMDRLEAHLDDDVFSSGQPLRPPGGGAMRESWSGNLADRRLAAMTDFPATDPASGNLRGYFLPLERAKDLPDVVPRDLAAAGNHDDDDYDDYSHPTTANELAGGAPTQHGKRHKKPHEVSEAEKAAKLTKRLEKQTQEQKNQQQQQQQHVPESTGEEVQGPQAAPQPSMATMPLAPQKAVGQPDTANTSMSSAILPKETTAADAAKQNSSGALAMNETSSSEPGFGSSGGAAGGSGASGWEHESQEKPPAPRDGTSETVLKPRWQGQIGSSVASGALQDAFSEMMGKHDIPMSLLDTFSAVIPLLFLTSSMFFGDLRAWTKCCLVASVLAVLKGFLAWATVVPDSIGWHGCQARLGPAGLAFFRSSQGLNFQAELFGSVIDVVVMEIFGVRWRGRQWHPRFCADMMFSGHTYVCCVFAVGLYDLCRNQSADLRLGFRRLLHFTVGMLLLCVVLVDVTLMVANRFHYTMDVTVAAVLVMLLYSNPAIAILTERWASGADIVEDEVTVRPIGQKGEYGVEVRDNMGSLLVPPCCFPLCCVSGRYHLTDRPDLSEIFAFEMDQVELRAEERMRLLRQQLAKQEEATNEAEVRVHQANEARDKAHKQAVEAEKSSRRHVEQLKSARHALGAAEDRVMELDEQVAMLQEQIQKLAAAARERIAAAQAKAKEVAAQVAATKDSHIAALQARLAELQESPVAAPSMSRRGSTASDATLPAPVAKAATTAAEAGDESDEDELLSLRFSQNASPPGGGFGNFFAAANESVTAGNVGFAELDAGFANFADFEGGLGDDAEGETRAAASSETAPPPTDFEPPPSITLPGGAVVTKAREDDPFWELVTAAAAENEKASSASPSPEESDESPAEHAAEEKVVASADEKKDSSEKAEQKARGAEESPDNPKDETNGEALGKAEPKPAKIEEQPDEAGAAANVTEEKFEKAEGKGEEKSEAPQESPSKAEQKTDADCSDTAEPVPVKAEGKAAAAAMPEKTEEEPRKAQGEPAHFQMSDGEEAEDMAEKEPQGGTIEELTRTVIRRLPVGPRLCVLGGTELHSPDGEALVAAIAKAIVASDLASKFVVVTGGMSGVQECFAKTLGSDFPSLIHLLPEGQASNFGVGRDVEAGRDLPERIEVFGRLGHIYISVEGGPGVAKEARAAFERGAIVLPLISTGGASSGMFDFPAGALERPAALAEAVSEESWASLSAKGDVEATAKALVEMLEAFVVEASKQPQAAEVE
eukprot:TRINITY_DN1211_c1_g1_i2.p1 TRINITY_DN1211_c1_g1~~TRINITY_DN1211_c1_g1_i2.p1  ORF type:complete len:1355 (-),score=374.47 TRINITY_DN1211_c1_g1_i2:103-4167(-)